MGDYEREVQHLLDLYETVPTDSEEAYDSDNSLGEVDHVEHQIEHETNEEIENELNEANEENVIVTQEEEAKKQKDDRSLFLYGKDGTKWYKHFPTRTVKTRQENIVSHLPGPIRAARDALTPIDAWNLFFDEITDLVVSYTNLYIAKVAGNYKDKNDARPTSKAEIKSFFGLLYLAGLEHGARKNFSEFWGTDGMGTEIFTATMSQRRFKFLLRVLRFDDTATRIERREIDKIAPIREVFDLFIEKCKSLYSLGEYVTLDEMLLAFRGRCSFRMYMPQKPNKYGLKVFSLVDARTFYTSNMEIYAGQQPDGPFRVDNSTQAVSLRMCQPIFGSGRNVTIDRWFTSYGLIQTLLKDHRITVVGTIRSNKPQLPPLIKNAKGRAVPSTIFAYGPDMTILSHAPKKNKNVIMASSFHRIPGRIDSTSEDLQKPEVITFYNGTKSGVDVVDKMTTSYNVARATRRWPQVVFYNIMNIANINAFVIHRHNNPATECSNSRRLFIRHLGLSLVHENIIKRASMKNLPTTIQQTAAKYAGIVLEEEPTPAPTKRGYCKYCRRRKTRYFCKFCKCWLCMEHIIACCRECADRNM